MKDKVCLICKTTIDTDGEFLDVKHMKNSKDTRSRAFYHIQCFRDRLNGAKEQKEALKLAVDTLKQAKEKLGLSSEEVVKI